MHIGLVLPAPPAYSETFFQSKISGLLSAGHQVILFTGKADPNFNLCPVVIGPGVTRNKVVQLAQMILSLVYVFFRAPRPTEKFYRLERESGRTFRQAIENLYLNSHILIRKLDWLHFGFATMSVRRENTASAIGAKMAVSLRGYDISLYPLKNPGCYEFLWHKADKVHAISDALIQKAYQQGLSKAKSVVKITPAINSELFKRSAPSPKPSNPLQLVTVARLKWVKGLEYILEALATLQKNGVDFHYKIIGEGEEYERICFAAHQLGIGENVSFIGKLPHADVKNAMEKADIYLQYSLQEGFCNAVLEAQAMGLLCIVSDAEGLPENVLHGQTGWVVPKRQPKLLANQILEILEMPEEKRQVIKETAIERVRKDFNLEKQKLEFLDFYNE